MARTRTTPRSRRPAAQRRSALIAQALAGPANAGQFSYCTSAPGGPSLNAYVTDALVPDALPRTEIDTECLKQALVTSVPTITAIGSGGTFNTLPIQWNDSDGVALANVMTAIDVSKDIATEMRQVGEVQAALSAVLMTQELGRPASERPRGRSPRTGTDSI